jgi:hypothetical protein
MNFVDQIRDPDGLDLIALSIAIEEILLFIAERWATPSGLSQCGAHV